jgi:solute carrier family 25 phosphate transporter 23/24/25/41
MDYKITLAGTTTAVVTKTVTAPLDRMKILYQLQALRNPGKYGNVWNTTKTICAEEGVRGLYKGNFVNTLRCIPSYSLKFTFNEYYKKVFTSETKPSFTSLIGVGMLTGVSQISLTYPLDLLKTRYSMAETNGSLGSYTMKMLKTEGIPGFYKGMSVSLLSGSLHVGIQMSAFDIYKHTLDRDTMYSKMTCGSMAGLTALLLTYPGDMVKKRMHVNGVMGDTCAYRNTRHCVQEIMKHERLIGFYRGAGISVLKTVPSAAIQFTVFDMLKKYV